MLKNKVKCISQAECRLIEQIACDLDSGNHLLRPRSKEYWDMWNIMVEARDAEKNGVASTKQNEMVEYERQCRDYSYWRKLPNDKKLFVEVEQ